MHPSELQEMNSLSPKTNIETIFGTYFLVAGGVFSNIKTRTSLEMDRTLDFECYSLERT
jgi:hypothetical protein